MFDHGKQQSKKKKFIISEHYDLRADLIVGGACAVSRFLVSMNTIVSINAVSKNPGANKSVLALLNYARASSFLTLSRLW